MNDRGDNYRSKDTYNENINIDGGNYIGRDFFDGDRVEQKIVKHESAQYTVPYSDKETEKENRRVGILDFVSNILSIDIIKVAALAGKYLGSKQLIVGAVLFLIVNLAILFDHLPFTFSFGIMWLFAAIMVMLVLGLFCERHFEGFHERYSCPHCSEQGENFTSRVQWHSVVDSEKLIEEYECRNGDYIDEEVYALHPA